ncbi:hypothetical protein MSG28_009057 [Choristoneura fumiferana]|nr:hypothetical protein MSG28_009057 [Choristoneura fumiferana]
MALVPPENAVSSDSSSSSVEEVDIPLHTSTQMPPIIQDDSDASSEPHSIPHRPFSLDEATKADETALAKKK